MMSRADPPLEWEGTMKNTAALALLLIGIIGLVSVYSMRPPSGLMDALSMMSENRQHFIKRPLYQIFLGIFGLMGVTGGVTLLRRVSRDDSVR
jgi:cell division protein FtsW (lipid II flippase)